MGIYGDAAAKAAAMIAGYGFVPGEAWDRAIIQVTPSPNSQKKGCPRAAFLALCETGSVEGVSPGLYTTSSKNKPDILRALEVVREDEDLLRHSGRLWQLATADVTKQPNGQLDVLRGLWRAGKLR